MRLQKELLADLDGQLLLPEEPFLEKITLGEYLALSDREKDGLWEIWANMDLMELEEREITSNVLVDPDADF